MPGKRFPEMDIPHTEPVIRSFCFLCWARRGTNCWIDGEMRHIKSTFTHTWSGRECRRAENRLQQKSSHAFTHARSRSGSKICSVGNGANSQFSASASKPRAQTYFIPHRHCRRTRLWECQNPSVSTPQPLRACVNVALLLMWRPIKVFKHSSWLAADIAASQS